MKQVTQIWGAGLAGLVAAQAFQNATIIERREKSPEGTHKALLRFRSPAVGEFLGIPFRPVTVRKAVYSQDAFVQPTMKLANWYAQKVIGRYADRSIWNLDTVERYIAPEDLVPQLLERFESRIEWGRSVNTRDVPGNSGVAVLSTLPMGFLETLLPLEFSGVPAFERQKIAVKRWRVKGCDLHQTVYFPDINQPLYRASITGDLLIAEFIMSDRGTMAILIDSYYEDLFHNVFGFSPVDMVKLADVAQEYGKIVPVDEGWRRNFVFQASQQFGVYSLGRFGTWRNILIDDVLQDVNVIRRLLNTDSYGARQAMFSQ